MELSVRQLQGINLLEQLDPRFSSLLTFKEKLQSYHHMTSQGPGSACVNTHFSAAASVWREKVVVFQPVELQLCIQDH